MPPKKAEPAVAERAEPSTAARYLERVRANVVGQEEGELLCGEIMQLVVQRAEGQVLSNYYDRTAIPYTVQGVCKELLDLVQFVFISRDQGDTTPESLQSWTPDPEPEPCPTDTWARGAIPVRKRAEGLDTRAATPTRRVDCKKPAMAKSGEQVTPTSETSRATRSANHAKLGQSSGVLGKSASAEKTQAEAKEVPAIEDEALVTQRAETRRRAELREAAERQNQVRLFGRT